ncbi:MAG: hypothetical protein J2P52_02295 [Blastocatellia bacterium]|nr:hypothetical protein [Blastocatellia bacterium]
MFSRAAPVWFEELENAGALSALFSTDTRQYKPADAQEDGAVTFAILVPPEAPVSRLINRRKIMKKFQMSLKVGGALVMTLASLFTPPAGPSVQAKMKNSLTATSAVGVEVKIDIGRKKKGCGGFGACSVTISGTLLTDREVKGILSANPNGNLTLAFLAKPPDEGTTFFIDEDISLPPVIANKLGFKSATLLQGEYPYNSRRCVLNARLVK